MEPMLGSRKMLLRMYLPAVLVAGSGLLVAEWVRRSGDRLGEAEAAHLASQLFLLAIVLGMAWALHSSWRLYRWLKHLEQRCECGGLLSRPRLDLKGHRYRKCLACGGREGVC